MSLLYIPHNDLDQFHGRLIQGVEKFQEDTTFFTHLPNDDTKHNTEHDYPQYVDSFDIWPSDFIVLGYILPREEKKEPFHSTNQDQARKLH